jgi:isopentenyl diphosphate isomerase/L-lactate dehydrogenase-like FMN-dependent dehydrogenase
VQRLTNKQYDGAEGVKLAVNLLHDEFKIAMSLAG